MIFKKNLYNIAQSLGLSFMISYPYSSVLAVKKAQEEQESQSVSTPQTILADGVDSNLLTNPYTGEVGYVRKGTIAATLCNIAELDRKIPLLESLEDIFHLQPFIKAIEDLIPSLNVAGLFNFFTPEEWIASKNHPGRLLTACLYLKHYPQKITPTLLEKLKEIHESVSSPLLMKAIEEVLEKY